MDNVSQGPPVRGGYRGRGCPSGRGYDGRGRYNSFFPNRGRGMGRGGPMRGGPPMMRGRGGIPRGPMRGMGGMPRGMGGMPRGPPPPSRGGRPPCPSSQGPNSVPPITDSNITATNGSQNQTSSRGMSRGGRGLPGRGRGGGGGGGVGVGGSSNHVPPPGTVGCLKPILPREDSNGIHPRGGRGSYQSVTRQLTGSSQPPPAGTTQGAPVLPIKRGAPNNGPPGSKRGRYDQGQQNRQIPLHHGPINSIPPQHVPQHNSYNNSQAPVQSSHHSSYQSHEQVQPPVVDSYSQAYSTQSQSYMNNGYSQSSYGQTPVATQSYAPVQEYDQHYQDYRYSTGPYGSQQDTRYQNYSTPDYSHQQYSSTTDYNTAPQESYSTSSYDDRTYGSYDTQAYSQGYANQGYY